MRQGLLIIVVSMFGDAIIRRPRIDREIRAIRAIRNIS